MYTHTHMHECVYIYLSIYVLKISYKVITREAPQKNMLFEAKTHWTPSYKNFSLKRNSRDERLWLLSVVLEVYTRIHAVLVLKISSNYRRKGNNTQQQISCNKKKKKSNFV